MATPGMIARRGSEKNASRPLLAITPRETSGNCSPRPRNDSVASARMIRANSSTARVSSADVRFGQDVLEHDPPRLAADHLGRLDVGPFLRRQDDAARHPGVDHPAVERQHEDQRAHARSEHGDHDQGDEQTGEGHLDVDPAHQVAVGAPAAVAGDEAEDDAERAGDEHDGEADEHRRARPVHQPGQHVVALGVGAEHVRPRAAVPDRRDVRRRRVALDRAVRAPATGRRRRRSATMMRNAADNMPGLSARSSVNSPPVAAWIS